MPVAQYACETMLTVVEAEMVVLGLLDGNGGAAVEAGVIISKSMYAFFVGLFGLLTTIVGFFIIDAFRRLRSEKSEVVKQFEKLEANMVKSIENLTEATRNLTMALEGVKLWVSDQFIQRAAHREDIDDVYAEVERTREACKEDIHTHVNGIRLLVEQFGKELESHKRYCPGRLTRPEP